MLPETCARMFLQVGIGCVTDSDKRQSQSRTGKNKEQIRPPPVMGVCVHGFSSNPRAIFTKPSSSRKEGRSCKLPNTRTFVFPDPQKVFGIFYVNFFFCVARPGAGGCPSVKLERKEHRQIGTNESRVAQMP